MKAWTTLRKWKKEHPEQWGAGQLIGPDKYCAVGYLLKSAGLDDYELIKVNSLTGDLTENEHTAPVQKAITALQTTYHLEEEDWINVIRLNDGNGLQAAIDYLRRNRL